LKLGECEASFSNKSDHFIEPVIMNLKIPYDVLCPTFYASWASKKEDSKVITLTLSIF